jgi:hypothetical protein
MNVRLDSIEAQLARLEQIKSTGTRFRVTAFTSSHKIVGTAFVAEDDYEDSWRASDFLRSIDSGHLILGEVEIRDITTGTIVDRPEFAMLNLKSVEVVYAEKNEPGEA